MADELGSEIPQPAQETDAVPARRSTHERAPGQKRLAESIKQQLRSLNAITAHYDSAKGRTGYIRFVVVDSADQKTHIALGASAQGGGNNEIGIERLDFVKAVWWDETTGQTGEVLFIDRPDEHSSRSKVVSDPIELSYVRYWRETGGIDFLPGGGGKRPAMTEDQLAQLATKLEGGHTNIDMTNGAMRHLQTTWGAERVKKE